MSFSQDIVVTWPSRRPLGSYLAELQHARREGLVVNFRIARAPSRPVRRCYVVHSGYVRGWSPVIEVRRRGAGEVARVRSDNDSGLWPAGVYVVRDPEWNPLRKEVPMRGFQGWRWIDGDQLR